MHEATVKAAELRPPSRHVVVTVGIVFTAARQVLLIVSGERSVLMVVVLVLAVALIPVSVASSLRGRRPAWRQDPARRFDSRYWDGDRWTEFVANDGIEQVDPLATSIQRASAG